MYRRTQITVLNVVIFCCACFATVFAQDLTQSIPVTPPPTRRIEPPPLNATPDDLEQQGDVLRREKAYLDSMDYYRAAIKKIKDDRKKESVIYNKLGMCEVQMGHYEEAKRTFEKAAKIDKTNPNAINNAGSMFYHDKKWGHAIKLYRRAIALAPDNAPFHANLGSAYIAHKEIDRGDAEYQAALNLDPDVFESRSNVGVSALMTPEDRAKYAYTLAKMYAKDGQMDRALLYLRRAMEEGYKDINNVYQDQEFAGLRKDERFVALMAQPPVSITGREP